MTAVLVLAVVACGGGGEDGATSRAVHGETFRNPVFAGDFPDPFVLRVGGTYYAYATNGGGRNVRTVRSADLVHWRRGPDALPTVGPWALEGKTWAPEVARLAGRYVLVYTADSSELFTQCIGRAVARSPAGPFVDGSEKPFLCQPDAGGSIDPSVFTDADGTSYLLWKNDGNSIGERTYLYAQRLSPDGRRLVGRRARLVANDRQWEAMVVEAPTLWRHGGRYYLFFSANAYATGLYAVGYATCTGPLGPCRDASENPILTSRCRAVGPGHQAIVRDAEGRTWLVYHAWRSGAVGVDPPGRQLWLDRLVWRDGRPVVRGPTCGAQAAP